MVEQDALEQTNRLLNQSLIQRAEELAALQRISASISQSLSLDETLAVALNAVIEVTHAQAGGISLLEAGTGDLVLRAQQGWLHDYVRTNPMRVRAGQGLSGRVIQSGEILVIGDLQPSEPLAVPRFHSEKFRALVMAPMRARGRIIGILSIMSTTPNSLNDISLDVLRSIADSVGVALDNARLYEEAREDHLRLSAILHSTADGILTTDRGGVVHIVNPAAAEMLGIDANDARGQHLSALPVNVRIRDILLFALTARGSGEGHWNKSYRITLERGRTIALVISPIRIESQLYAHDTEGWIIIVQDVTHLREAEVQRARFIQMAAHDMRNPLSAAMNAVALIRRMLNLDDRELFEVVQIAQTSIERVQALIADLSHLEHIDSGIDFDMQPTHIGEIIEYVCADMAPRIATKRLGFAVVLQPNLPAFMLEARLIRVAVANYLDNAITAANTRVLVNIYTNAPMLHIEVSDDGAGVAPEVQGRLFERFYRPSATRDTSTGLGLAIVKSIAEAHGGSVYLQSAPGEGSVFGFTLRMAEAAQPWPEAAAAMG